MKKGKATQAIHGRRDLSFGSSVFPIYPSTTFAVTKSDDYAKQIVHDEEFYMYTRYANPTTRNVEEKLAQLENGENALLFASGMTAITTTLIACLKLGDKIVAPRSVYGGTYRFLRDLISKFGIRVAFVGAEELLHVDKYHPDARLVYFETPINPTTDCIDIAQVVQAAAKINALTMVDNTFASPINQNPISLGIDLVVHSATKYIGGHTDVMAGAVIGSHKLIEQIHQTLKVLGGIINPIDAYLLDRSLKTLKVRVLHQNESALALAQFFAQEPKVLRVFYPGLPSSQSYSIARSQMRGFGGMLCIELKTPEAAKSFCDRLQIALNATSLGGVESLVSIPALTSHFSMTVDELHSCGLSLGMVRISVGLEDVDDLIEDFKNALATL